MTCPHCATYAEAGLQVCSFCGKRTQKPTPARKGAKTPKQSRTRGKTAKSGDTGLSVRTVSNRLQDAGLQRDSLTVADFRSGRVVQALYANFKDCTGNDLLLSYIALANGVAGADKYKNRLISFYEAA
jgi:hypothetical protein